MAVYFIQKGDDGPIKIGKSIDVLSRAKQLQAIIAEPLRILGIIDGYTSEELELHRRFASFRLEGEWFKPVDQIIKFILAHAKDLDYSGIALEPARKLQYDPFLGELLNTKFEGDLTRFARTADMSYSQAHDIMVNGITDGRRLGTLKKIAEAFEISVTRLITGK